MVSVNEDTAPSHKATATKRPFAQLSEVDDVDSLFDTQERQGEDFPALQRTVIQKWSNPLGNLSPSYHFLVD